MIFPVIGHKVAMPSNPEMKKIIEDLMALDGMTMAMFKDQT